MEVDEEDMLIVLNTFVIKQKEDDEDGVKEKELDEG